VFLVGLSDPIEATIMTTVSSVRVFAGGAWRCTGVSESKSWGGGSHRGRWMGRVGWTECVFTHLWRGCSTSAAHLRTYRVHSTPISSSLVM